jgi:hypothetical protein
MVPLNRTGAKLGKRFLCHPTNEMSVCAEPGNRSQCAALHRALQSARASYVEALASPFFGVSKAVAARTQVDMARAELDLESYEEACHLAIGAQIAEGSADSLACRSREHRLVLVR